MQVRDIVCLGTQDVMKKKGLPDLCASFGGGSFLPVADLTLIGLLLMRKPCIVCKARSLSMTSPNLTNPKPRDWPVWAFLTICNSQLLMALAEEEDIIWGLALSHNFCCLWFRSLFKLSCSRIFGVIDIAIQCAAIISHWHDKYWWKLHTRK